MSNKHMPPTAAIAGRRSITRVDTAALDEVEADQIAVGNRLLELLTVPVPGARPLDALGERLSDLTGVEYEVFFHTLRTHAGREAEACIDNAFLTSFRLAPDPDHGIVLIDMPLVANWLEELLSDEPLEAHAIGPPSERDFGLITFVLLHIARCLCERGLPPISLASAPPVLQTVTRRLRRHSVVVEAAFGVRSASASGQVRLLLPGALIRSMEVFVNQRRRASRRRRRLMRTRLGGLRAALPVTLGAVGLTIEEYRNLAPGDLILPTIHGLRAEKVEEADGAARLWLGPGAEAYLPCVVEPSEGSWRVEVTDPNPKTEREEAKMSDETSAETTSSADSETDLIDRARVEIEVRIGAVPLPVSTLAELQSGYVLELERRIDDPVDLIVDGEAVGEGELVSVEGRLGVRVVSVDA
ncbi:MAG: type III secretion system cytoplasmic ring protein SctQ [Persicimonas sp.]